MTYQEPYAEYIGGDSAPADLWGRAPMRGHACLVVEQLFDSGRVIPPHEVVDALIEAGLIVDELAARERCDEAFRAYRTRRIEN